MEWRVWITWWSYSVSDIQDYFKYILKNTWDNYDNASIMIYINKIENRITFKIKTRYYLELLTSETMKLLGSTTSKCALFRNYWSSISPLQYCQQQLPPRFKSLACIYS